eukprot:TRINITY_DN1468_c3_g1_i1.p1 TRINITY_DN1468_c3_g1~~TRINITY_DN1468_c3_g1_i1.p1  ORF type:complete len:423 (-),score=164.66 TRINITY_DN1468_c3_g1_i1:42-1310(-)
MPPKHTLRHRLKTFGASLATWEWKKTHESGPSGILPSYGNMSKTALRVQHRLRILEAESTPDKDDASGSSIEQEGQCDAGEKWEDLSSWEGDRWMEKKAQRSRRKKRRKKRKKEMEIEAKVDAVVHKHVKNLAKKGERKDRRILKKEGGGKKRVSGRAGLRDVIRHWKERDLDKLVEEGKKALLQQYIQKEKGREEGVSVVMKVETESQSNGMNPDSELSIEKEDQDQDQVQDEEMTPYKCGNVEMAQVEGEQEGFDSVNIPSEDFIHPLDGKDVECDDVRSDSTETILEPKPLSAQSEESVMISSVRHVHFDTNLSRSQSSHSSIASFSSLEDDETLDEEAQEREDGKTKEKSRFNELDEEILRMLDEEIMDGVEDCDDRDGDDSDDNDSVLLSSEDLDFDGLSLDSLLSITDDENEDMHL